MENHNWTQPSTTASPRPIFMNPQAPFINSLVNGTSGISDQVAYATNYINAGVGVHPSEPNYIWAEAGTNFGVFNDDTPYHADCSPDTVQTTDQHLSAFLTKARTTWRSYQEDTDVDVTTNVPLPRSAWTVPLFNLGGTRSRTGSTRTTTRHRSITRPSTIPWCTSATRMAAATRRRRIRCARNTRRSSSSRSICRTTASPRTTGSHRTSTTTCTPGLTNGYGGPVGTPNKGDSADIAQADNFLARIVPLIMASKAYKEHGIIVLWWDESEGGDTAAFTLPFMIISKDAHENVKGQPYASPTELSHSSTLRTLQEIFDVDPRSGFPWLGAAATADDLSDLFKPGTLLERP